MLSVRTRRLPSSSITDRRGSSSAVLLTRIATLRRYLMSAILRSSLRISRESESMGFAIATLLVVSMMQR
ncbi:hypothetical protein ABIA40_000259 [Bradyrhizobium sp. USDA 223]